MIPGVEDEGAAGCAKLLDLERLIPQTAWCHPVFSTLTLTR